MAEITPVTLTPEQKAIVKARTLESVKKKAGLPIDIADNDPKVIEAIAKHGGVTAGEEYKKYIDEEQKRAAQEVMFPGDEYSGEESDIPKPLVIPESQKPAIESFTSPDEAKRERAKLEHESKQKTAEIVANRAMFVRFRSAELQKKGIPEDQANRIATNEFNANMGTPLGTDFGDLKDKKPGFPGSILTPDAAKPDAGKPPGFLEVVRPRSIVPESAVKSEKERMETAQPVGGGGAEPDWSSFKRQAMDAGLTEQQAEAHIRGMKAVYNKLLQKASDNGIKKTPEQLIQETKLIVSNIEDRMKSYEKGEKGSSVMDPSTLVSEDEKWSDYSLVGKAIEKLNEPGKGIPALSSEQLSYLRESEVQARQDLRSKIKQEKDGETITIETGTKKPAGARGEDTYEKIVLPPVVTIKDPVERERVSKAREKYYDELVDKEMPKTWWLDPKTRSEVMSGTKKQPPGVLSSETYFGGTKESTAGWVLRMSAAPWNFVVGENYDKAFGAVAPESQAKTAQKGRQEKRPDELKEEPGLYNVLYGKGIGGENQDVADILGYEGAFRAGFIASGYAIDLLDPTLDMVGAGISGARAGVNTVKASRAAGIGSNLWEAGKAAAKAGVSEVGILGGPFYNPGNIRNAVAKTATKEAAAAEAISKALRESTSDINAIEDAIKAAPGNLEDTSFVKRWKAAAKESGNAEDAYKIASRDFKLAEEAEVISKGIDDVASGAETAVKNSDNVVREIAILAREDADLLSKLRAVDASESPGNRAAGYIKTLDASQTQKLKNRLISNAVTETVYKETKNMSDFDNVVQVTQNTFARKNDVKQILENASKTDVGIVAKQIKDSKVKPIQIAEQSVDIATLKSGRIEPTAISASRVKAAAPLTPDQAIKIRSSIDDLSRAGIIQDNIAKNIINSASGNNPFITLDNLRYMLEAEVDIAAQGSKKAIRSKDILAMQSPQQVSRILQPVETRAWGRDSFIDYMNGHRTQITNPLKTDVTPGQKSILDRAAQKAQNMDVVLRTEMEKMLNNTDYRKAITGSDAPLTKQEALAHIVVGPTTGRTGLRSSIDTVLESAISSSIYNKKVVEDVFDRVVGARLYRDVSVFNKEGQEVLSKIVSASSKVIAEDPKQLWPEMKKVLDGAAEIASVPEYRKIPELEPTILLNKTNGVIPTEIQIGAFYRAEADRITKDTIGDLVRGASSKLGLKPKISDEASDVLYNLSLDYNKKMNPQMELPFKRDARKAIEEAEFYADEPAKIMDRYVAQRINENLAGATIKNAADITPAYINKHYPELANIDPKIAKEIITSADDSALKIMNGTGLKAGSDPRDVSKLIKANIENPTLNKQLEIMFGTDIYNQIKNSIGAGGEKISKAMDDIIYQSYDAGDYANTMNALRSAQNAIESAFYTLVLNASLRFHGGNILGAPSLLYSTLGNQGLKSLLQMDTALKTLSRGGTSAGDVIAFSDKAGRSFTYNELYDLFSNYGGSSVYKFTAPDSIASNLKNVVTDSGKIDSGLKNTWYLFQDLPGKSDKFFRTTVGIQALKDGRTVDEALKLSRASMFDASDITEAEETVKRLTLFYGFTRNNLVNGLKNMSSIDGLKRLKRTYQVRSATEGIAGISQEQKDYRPSSAETKAIVDVYTKGKDTFYKGTWNDSTLSAVDTLIAIAEGHYADFATGMLRPGMKEALGLDEDREIKSVPPEHIAIYSALSMKDDKGRLVLPWLPEPIVPVPSTATGNIDGFIYPLLTEKEKAAYKNFMYMIGVIGISRVMQEYPRMLQKPGTSTEFETSPGNIEYSIALTTPIKGMSAEKTRLMNLAMQDKSNKEILKQIEKLELESPAKRTASLDQLLTKIYKDLESVEKSQEAEEEITIGREKAIEREEAIQTKRFESGEISEEEYEDEVEEIYDTADQDR